MPHRFQIIILTSLVVLAACNGEGARREQAFELTRAFGSALQVELKTALEAGGPVAAVTVCSERAGAIAAQSARDGLTVRRIGSRVRNPANAPTDAERTILDGFAMLPETERAGAFEERANGARHAWYAPIFISNALCLTCHGDPAGFTPELRQALATRYPSDAATGFGMGDLRGAFVVEAQD